MPRLSSDDRARIQFVDIIMAFASLVAFSAIAPWVYNAVSMATGTVDPLSGVLLQLTLPVFVISMIVSVGVSARTRG